MDIEDLKIFYTLCETLSFSEAGKKLNLSPSAISKRIAILEKTLNVSLFERHTRHVKLTSKGIESLKYARTILDEIENFQKHINNDTPSGTLDIIGGENSLSSILLGSLDKFLEKHPLLQLNIIGTNVIPQFSTHKTEVGILAYIENQPNLIQKYLMTFNLGLFASKSYIKKFGAPLKAEELSNHRLIVFGSNDIPFSSPINWALTVGKPPGELHKPYFIINTVPMTYMVAKKGIGIVTLPKESAFLKDKDIVPILPKIEGPKLKTYYICRDLFAQNKAVIALEGHLRKIIKKHNWS